MSTNRESSVIIRSTHYKQEDVKFKFAVRVDFGLSQCSQRLNIIKSLGISPANNCIVVTHEFDTDSAAAKAAERISGFKEMGPFGKPEESLKIVKAEGRKLIVVLQMEESFDKDMEEFPLFAINIGKFADIHQWIELNLESSKSIKDIAIDTSISPLASVLGNFCLKAKLSMQKELPIKIGEFIINRKGISTEYEKIRHRIVSYGIAAFHHLNIEIDLKEPEGSLKDMLKKEIHGVMVKICKEVMEMLEQWGIMEAIKEGGANTRLLLCIDPLLSFEVNLYAPTTYETVKELASSELIPSN